MSVLLSAVILFTLVPLTFAADCEHTNVNDSLVCEDCSAEMKAKAVKYDQSVKYFDSAEDALTEVINNSKNTYGYEYGGCTLYLYEDYSGDIYLRDSIFKLNADGHTVFGDINADSSTNFTIEGGTFRGKINVQHNTALFTITGGTFENAIEVYAAAYTVFSGGTFNNRIYSHADYDRFYLGNITCNGQIVIPGAGGVSITAGNYYGDITVANGAYFYVPASSSAVFGSDMYVNINEFGDDGTKAVIGGGTFNGTVNVYAGTLEMPTFARIAVLNVFSKGKVSIEEGEFKSISCTMGQTCSDLLAKRHIYYNTTDGVYINSADSNVTELSNVKAEKCSCLVYDDDYKCKICSSYADAKVVDFNGRTEVFTELKDAFEYASLREYGADVILIDDVDLKESIMLSSGSGIKFNMNGKSLNNYYDNNSSGILTAIPLTVTGNGTSSVYFGVVNMGTTDGQLTILNGTFNSFIAAMGPVKLNIADGTFNDYVSISASAGMPAVTLNGGSFKRLTAKGEYYDWDSALGENMLYKTTANEMFKKFTFRGETVYGFDGSEDDAMLDVVYHLYHTSVTDDLKCADCGVQTIAEAKINDGESVYFETLAGALYYSASNAGKNDTANVKLFADDEMTTMTNLKTDGKIVLDFNGKTLNSKDFGSIVLKGGTLTVTGDGNVNTAIITSSVDGTGDKFLTIENGTFTYSVTVYGAETTINGGKFADLQIISGDKKFIINDGEFDIVGISESTNITLNGGTFTEFYVINAGDEYDMNSLLGEGKVYSSARDGGLFGFITEDNYLYGFDGTADGTVLIVKDKENTDPDPDKPVDPEEPENPGDSDDTKHDDSGKLDDGFGLSKCKILEKILEFIRKIVTFFKSLFTK